MAKEKRQIRQLDHAGTAGWLPGLWTKLQSWMIVWRIVLRFGKRAGSNENQCHISTPVSRRASCSEDRRVRRAHLCQLRK